MQEHLDDFWKVIVEYWMLIWLVIATSATAMLRTAKEHGKADYIEASLCSLFSTSIWFMLDWLGLPPGRYRYWCIYCVHWYFEI